MSKDIDNLEFIDVMKKQIQESEEEFIYTAISPFCETITEKKLSKRELEKILRKGMQPSIPLDKVKQARESVQKYINECDEVLANSVAGINMKSGLTLALEILDKLIESEGKE